MGISADDAAAAYASAKTPADVDRKVLGFLKNGGTPDYIATKFWKWVEISGRGHTLRILVAPDYHAIGEDSSSVFRTARTTPYGAQTVASFFNAILPSQKLLRDIQTASNPRLTYIDIKRADLMSSLGLKSVPVSAIEAPASTELANEAANRVFARKGIEPGDGLTIGYKKAIVVAPGLDGSKVAIAGGIPGPGDPVSKPPYGFVQGFSTVHGSAYSDYSHGIVLISRKAELDGEPVDLRFDVFGSKDPNVVALVSDQGRFDPVYPNAGKSSEAKFSTSSAAPKGEISGGATSSASSSNGLGTAGKVVLGAGALGLILWWLG